MQLVIGVPSTCAARGGSRICCP